MWFEKLNFVENPFEESNIRLVGYENILDDILYNISAGNIVFIEGKKGYGKSSLLKKAINEFRGDGKVAYINGEKLQDPNIENVLMSKQGFFGKLLKKRPKGMIILMDDIEILSEKNLERIKYFYDQNYIRSIVFTGRDFNKISLSESLKERISTKIILKNFTEEDAVEMIQIRFGENEILKNDQIKLIFKNSSDPKDFLNKCEEICKLASKEDKKEVTKEIINKFLGKKEKVKKEVKKKVEEKPKMEIIEEKPKEVKKEVIEIKQNELEEVKEVTGEEEPVKLIYEDIAEKYY